ncbi:Pilus assembly protein, PilP [Snodgrassella alvi SCGC AB-598-O02]|nr:Pilus assembly protein, PilP [Snodgrassella alvi SCGC AB-598-O02]
MTIGNYLGQNYGRITAITPDEIIISELLEDATGSWSDHPNNLPLQSQDQTGSNS